jgi:hypothetical protein
LKRKDKERGMREDLVKGEFRSNSRDNEGKRRANEIKKEMMGEVARY